ncbi:YdcH family protein [Roseovarius phycicola]|uniref:YdcH family protein n=1 Tax=Roseovarius phycicola TaxID=3080976 RepID=A0ABZ2HD05_9RHOB
MRKVSPKSLQTRIDTLRRRHRELDDRISTAQSHKAPDFTQIKQLKQEKLGLRDAIRMTQSLLARLHAKKTKHCWQTQFHSG